MANRSSATLKRKNTRANSPAAAVASSRHLAWLLKTNNACVWGNLNFSPRRHRWWWSNMGSHLYFVENSRMNPPVAIESSYNEDPYPTCLGGHNFRIFRAEVRVDNTLWGNFPRCSCFMSSLVTHQIYRVTIQLVANLPLTSKQKFHFGLARPGARAGQAKTEL